MIKLVKNNGYLFVTLADGNVISGRIENFEFQQENTTSRFDLVYKGRIIADSVLFSDFADETAFASVADLIEFYTTLQNPLPVIEQNTSGAFGYVSGVSGTVTLTGGKKVKSITAVSTAGGTIVIDGGDTFIIPPNGNFTDDCNYNLVDAEIVFTGTVSYYVSYIS